MSFGNVQQIGRRDGHWAGFSWPWRFGPTAWDEPKELDTENEAVISLYDGIKKILENQSRPKPKSKGKAEHAQGITRDATHVLQCGRILKVDIERKLVMITLMKADGELHQLRIEAKED